MKPYFAKWLPVEEKVKSGSTVMLGYGTLAVVGEIGSDLFEDCPVVKLFLCSRDIQEGDKIYLSQSKKTEIFKYQRPDGRIICESGDEKEYPKELSKQEFFKVIGQISPEATWVEDGDEFELTDFNPLSAANIEHNYPLTGPIRIKGPCGHYH